MYQWDVSGRKFRKREKGEWVGISLMNDEDRKSKTRGRKGEQSYLKRAPRFAILLKWMLRGRFACWTSGFEVRTLLGPSFIKKGK